ncbi:hypothetical protein Scep_001594 [Stephania cephalantha]|uniref:Thioredoxin-like 4, chloroplastic n=1 Tax=Stephania cephalantha TaxID=152367 RepID=A0AAP0Q442_9MAGN
MQRQNILHQSCSYSLPIVPDGHFDSRVHVIHIFHPGRIHAEIQLCRSRIPSIMKNANLKHPKMNCSLEPVQVREVRDNFEDGLSDEDDELCPVECVKEFKTNKEFFKILEKAKETNSLVVVDFYRTSCGSCKYIEQGFSKLCKGSGNQEAAVIFLKHNVIDEYDEQSEVAERLRIKTVPLFHFYKDGVLLEAFPTRDKERILSAILKYTM